MYTWDEEIMNNHRLIVRMKLQLGALGKWVGLGRNIN